MSSCQVAAQYRVGVRELAEFNWEGWGSCREISRGIRDGLKIQQLVQQSRPEGYEHEVSLAGAVLLPEGTLQVGGRLDGLYPGSPCVLEEIKTTRRSLKDLLVGQNPAHWAQLKIYAFLLCRASGLEHCRLHLTYFLVSSSLVQTFVEDVDLAVLEREVRDLAQHYLDWRQALSSWQRHRDEQLAQRPFPFKRRPGQQQIEACVRDTARDGGVRLVEAPTGLGKTLSALYGGLVALSAGEIEQLVYSCPRTTGKGRAVEALQTLSPEATSIKVVVLTARDKICGQQCSREFLLPVERASVRQLFFEEHFFDEKTFRRLAAERKLCPYALSLEFARWADVVVADFHYWLAPGTRRHGRRDRGSGKACLLLVDEAHQIPDRAVSLYSSKLDVLQLTSLAATVGFPQPCATRIDYLDSEVGEPQILGSVPPPPLKVWLEKLSSALEHLSESDFGSLSETQRETTWELNRFLALSEQQREGLACWTSSVPEPTLRQDCLDSLPFVRERLAEYRGALLFSATLQPASAFQGLVEDPFAARIEIEPSFPAEHLKVLVAGRLRTVLRSRKRGLPALGRWLRIFAGAVPGHCLLFFPSYRYLWQAYQSLLLAGGIQHREIFLENPDWPEFEKRQVISRLAGSSERQVGFCVLGGSFAESIEVPGNGLRGIAIVGPGLPPPSFRRNLVYEHFEEKGESGFEMAYLVPGMRKVVQAAGRLIRSHSDRGTLLLIGKRFLLSEYWRHLPQTWQFEEASSAEDLREKLQDFWGEQ